MLVQWLQKLGFVGPRQEGKHPYMIKEGVVFSIPNIHEKEIGVDLLLRVLKQMSISRDVWDKTK